MIHQDALDALFLDAHTAQGFLPKPVPDDLLRRVWDIAKMGPTSLNCNPMRVVFVRTPEGKERLRPAMSAGNLDKTMAAPVTAIFAFDLAFYEELPRLFPFLPARDWFANSPAFAESTSRQSATLQAAYFMIVARGLGLGCGPMAGFQNNVVDEAFFAGTTWRSNFLCNLGYADPTKAFPRGPRLDFDAACRLD